MHSVRYPNVSSRPVIGLLTIMIILVFLFLVAGIQMNEIFTVDGFIRIYNRQPWIIYLAIGITTYALLNIWKVNIGKNERQGLESFDCTSLITFDKFFEDNFTMRGSASSKRAETGITSQGEDESVSELSDMGQESMDQESMELHKDNLYDPMNTFMVLRTKINDHYYYLITKSDTEQHIYSNVPKMTTRKEIMCRACKTETVNGTETMTRYIRPVLIREDILNTMNTNFINDSKSQLSEMTPPQVSQVPQTAQVPQTVQVPNSLDTLPDIAPSSTSGNDSSSITDNVKELINSNLNNLSTPNLSDLSDTDTTVGGIIQPPVRTIASPQPNNANSVENFSVGNNKNTYYPKFVHHMSINSANGQQNSNRSNKNDNTPSTPAYNIFGIYQEQTTDLKHLNNQSGHYLSIHKTFSPTFLIKNLDDKIFVCSSNETSDSYESIYSESFAPLLTDSDSSSTDLANSPLFDSSLVASHKKLGSVTNLYFYNDNKKYYIAKLNNFGPRTLKSNAEKSDTEKSDTEKSDNEESSQSPDQFPVGLIPDNYVRPDHHNSLEPDFSLSEKIDFEVIMVKLAPFN